MNCQKTKPNKPRKTKPETVENKSFEASGRLAKKRTSKTYGFLETLEFFGKQGFQLADPAARKGDPRRLPARDEKLHWDRTENVGIPYVS